MKSFNITTIIISLCFIVILNKANSKSPQDNKSEVLHGSSSFADDKSDADKKEVILKSKSQTIPKRDPRETTYFLYRSNPLAEPSFTNKSKSLPAKQANRTDKDKKERPSSMSIIDIGTKESSAGSAFMGKSDLVNNEEKTESSAYISYPKWNNFSMSLSEPDISKQLATKPQDKEFRERSSSMNRKSSADSSYPILKQLATKPQVIRPIQDHKLSSSDPDKSKPSGSKSRRPQHQSGISAALQRTRNATDRSRPQTGLPAALHAVRSIPDTQHVLRRQLNATGVRNQVEQVDTTVAAGTTFPEWLPFEMSMSSNELEIKSGKSVSLPTTSADTKSDDQNKGEGNCDDDDDGKSGGSGNKPGNGNGGGSGNESGNGSGLQFSMED